MFVARCVVNDVHNCRDTFAHDYMMPWRKSKVLSHEERLFQENDSGPDRAKRRRKCRGKSLRRKCNLQKQWEKVRVDRDRVGFQGNDARVIRGCRNPSRLPARRMVQHALYHAGMALSLGNKVQSFLVNFGAVGNDQATQSGGLNEPRVDFGDVQIRRRPAVGFVWCELLVRCFGAVVVVGLGCCVYVARCWLVGDQLGAALSQCCVEQMSPVFNAMQGSWSLTMQFKEDGSVVT